MVVRRNAAHVAFTKGEHLEGAVLDLMFVAIVLVFFGLTFGYAAFCDRL